MLFLSNNMLILFNLLDYIVLKKRKVNKNKYDKIFKINNNVLGLYNKSIDIYQI